MKISSFFKGLGWTLGALFLFVGILWWQIKPSPRQTWLFEQLLRHQTKEYFGDSLRLNLGWIDPKGYVRMENLRAEMKNASKTAAPITIDRIDSLQSILKTFQGDPLELQFKGLTLGDPDQTGASGLAVIQPGKSGSMVVTSDIESLNLTHLVWLDPVHLKGLQGILKGKARLSAQANASPQLELSLEVPEGGQAPSAFFDLIKPYIPKPTRKALRAAQKEHPDQNLIPFSKAFFQIQMLRADSMKVFLKMFIPVYNLDLNLNLEIRLDSQTTLQEITEILGWFQIQ